MDRIQVHPSGFIDPSAPQSNSKFLAPEALRGSGGLLLNARGERFANELGSRSYLADAILTHCSPHEVLLETGRTQPFAFMLLNQQVGSPSTQ
jgi:aspartate oxidase